MYVYMYNYMNAERILRVYFYEHPQCSTAYSKRFVYTYSLLGEPHHT